MHIDKVHLTIKRACIFLVVITCLVIIDYTGFFQSFDNYFYDLSFRIRGNIPSLRGIILIKIDDKTLERLGRWPIKRSNYTHLINKIADARVILFDIVMTEPTEEDKGLGDVIKRQGNVLLPVLIGNNQTVKYPSVPHIMRNTGHVHIEPDVDGIVRGVYHTLTLNNISLPSITSVAYEIISGMPFKRQDIKQHSVRPGSIVQSDKMKINYVGGHDSFDNISFIDVIQGLYPPSFFKGRIVFVGLTATGTFDILLTPFQKERRGMPGIEVQANILNTLILGNAIRDVPAWLRWLFTFIVSTGFFIFFMGITERWAAISGLIFLLSVIMISYLSLTRLNIWIAPAVYCIGIFLTFMISYIYKFDDAVAMLGRAYKTLEPHLRWKGEKAGINNIREGLTGVLTKRGINTQIQVLTDVGRQMSFEKELTERALMSDIHGVMLFDHDGNNMLINELARDIFQGSNIDTYTLEGFIKSIHPHLLERPEPESVIEKICHEQTNAVYTLALAEKEKRYYKVDFSSFNVEGAGYILIIVTDITRIKELELLKGHIISVVSHELKSPMTSIQGFSEILSKNLTGKMQNFAAIINRESERLVRFLNTFLDITRIEEGRQPVRITPVNLMEVVKEVASALKPIGDTNHISILTEIPDKIDNIMVDRDLTKQCIFNLVENAIKYSPPNRDVIIRLEETGDYERIDIIDHGYGIKEEDLGRIFDKFFRSTSDKTKNIKGSGLGLTFVKEAVELQGGRLTLSSRYNEGSTFSIIFPKQKKTD